MVRIPAAIGLCLLMTLVESAAASQPDIAITRLACASAGADSPTTAPAVELTKPAPVQLTELKLNPSVFFQRLVDRYRGLNLYKDVVSIVQVTQREGVETSRVETQISCEVADGKLKVQTPGTQARQQMGVDLPMKQSKPMEDAQQKYDLWLAPHMALKFTDQPLKELRTGVDDGFTATEAESVTIDNKKMVHVELRGGCSGDGLSEDCSAKFDLYVNRDSMLIERIEGEQKLPDGGSCSTTLTIAPEKVEGVMPAGPAT